MKSFFRIVFALIACMCLSFGSVVHAQSPEPPIPPSEMEFRLDRDRLESRSRVPEIEERFIVSTDFPIAADNTILATAGPDQYGYTWDDNIPLNWIDASDGTTVGNSGNSNNNPYGPYSIPFSFKFYENTYTEVNISQNGYITFATDYYSQNEIPSPRTPNNRIAPYANRFYLDTGSWVRYKSGGTTPNRYFVVEWHDVSDPYNYQNKSRFETIIYENGNILFQYQAMSIPNLCGSAGIEDSSGTDGLAYLSFCSTYPSYKAVLFTRPAPSARVSVYPGQFGGFAGTNQTAEIQVPIRNNGELGADVYDLELNSTNSTWTRALYDAGGATLLTDTDGDSIIDTGPVPQGGSVTITVKFEPPALAASGDNLTAWLNVTSSLNPSVARLATLKTAIPAPFAQLLKHSSQQEMTLALIQPTMNAESLVDPQNWGNPSAVVEVPNGNFIYVWSEYRCLDTACNSYGAEVYFAILDRAGRAILPATRVASNYGASTNVYDNDPTVAVAPNGNIAILWHRDSYPSGTRLSNLYLAILDSNGHLLKSPTNLTNEANTIDIRFNDWAIAATGDNRFHLTWSKRTYTDTGSIEDVYFMAFESSGVPVRGLTKMTADTSSYSDGFIGSEITVLQNNRSMLLWSSDTSDDLHYLILDSAGTVLSGPTNLTADGTSQYDYDPAAVQLPNGKIFVTWKGNSTLRYAVLNASYQRIVGPASLDPSGALYDAPPSVTADSASRAIITWGDWNLYNNLYYSLVDSSGTVLTQPMIFRSSEVGNSIYEGYVQSSNTSFSNAPSADVDAWVQSDPLVLGQYSENIVLNTVQYGNAGFTPTSSTVLQATLDPNLTLLASQVTPASQAGNVYTWNISDLDWLDSGQLYIVVSYPYAAPGTQYPIEWTITSAGTETNSTDNTFMSYVVVAHKVYLPLLTR